MKNIISTMWKTFLIILLSAIIGTVVLILTFALPVERVHKNVEKGMGETLLREGPHPTILGATLDNYTDAMYLNEALVGGEGFSAKNALSGFVLNEDLEAPIDALLFSLENRDKVSLSASCKHFWNGYIIPIKILLQVVSYCDIRMIIEYCVFASLLLACYLMYRRNLGIYIIPFLLATMCINPFSLALSLTFCGFYFCTIIPCILVLWKNEWLLFGNRYYYLFVITGIAAIFFNMNYFQLISFGIPIIFFYLLNQKQSTKELLKRTLFFFFGWFVGYAGMMVFKWIVYAIFVDFDIFMEMLLHIKFRLSASAYGAKISRIGTVAVNLRELLMSQKMWTVTELLFCVYCIIMFFRKRQKNNRIALNDYLMLIISMGIPVCRCLLYANHMWIHRLYTYRVFMIPIFMLNVFLIKNSGLDKGQALASDYTVTSLESSGQLNG